jgi:hypothetical protein
MSPNEYRALVEKADKALDGLLGSLANGTRPEAPVNGCETQRITASRVTVDESRRMFSKANAAIDSALKGMTAA